MTDLLVTSSVCQRCAAQGPTCCSMSPENLEFCFPLAQEEMEILQTSAPEGTDVFAQEPNSSGFITQLAGLLPEYNVRQVFTATGTHWRLAVTQEGNCIFLGETGCRLDQSIRPRYCRLFPLWCYQGQLTWFAMPECLAYKEYPRLPDLLVSMHTNEEEVRTLFAAMCLGLGLEPRR